VAVSALDLVCATCGALPGAPCVGIAPATHPLRAVSGQPRPDDVAADLEAALIRTTRELIVTRYRADALAEAVASQELLAHQVLAQWSETVDLARRALLALERVRFSDTLHEAQDAAADALAEAEAHRPARA